MGHSHLRFGAAMPDVAVRIGGRAAVAWLEAMAIMVRGLTPSQLLEVWERGSDRKPVEQALVILMAACDQPPDGLDTLSLGRRDALLLRARAQTFGSMINGWVTCPCCGERLEFTTDVAAIQSSQNIPDAEVFDGRVGNLTVTMRLPNSRDLLALSACADVATARRQLVERCVQSDQSLRIGDMGDEWLDQLAAQLSAHDPQSEILLAMSCAACDARWSALFDIGVFFWHEIAAQAQRLLREVHGLARAYGWREADILGMSTHRRQSYLAMIEQT